MTQTPHNSSAGDDARGFTTTRWSMVLAADKASPDSSRALESLCEAYWCPLYAYVRRRVVDVHNAQDLTQAFFAELLSKNVVASADAKRGRFRTFLLTACQHFLSKEWRKAKAQKRGGGKSTLPLDFETADTRLTIEPCAGLTPEQLYHRQWVVTLLETLMRRLKEEFAQEGEAPLFAILKGFILGEHGDTTYAAAALQANMTEAALKMSASRLRRRYRELLREEILQTVAGPDEVEDEIRSLFATLET